MSSNLEQLLTAALVGLAGWFVKDFAFGLIRRRNELERNEWEYRLKEIFCPLYFWSGLLTMRTRKELTYQISDRLHDVMARAAYVVPRVHYYTLIKLLESAHEQETSPATEDERSRLRTYLYNQIEALNFILYRSEDAGGVGDPIATLSPYKRLLRLLLIGVTQLLFWLLAALGVGGTLWLYQHRYFDLLRVGVVLLLVVLLVDIRQRATVRKELEQRIKADRSSG
jgi:hypothetical protein